MTAVWCSQALADAKSISASSTTEASRTVGASSRSHATRSDTGIDSVLPPSTSTVTRSQAERAARIRARWPTCGG